MQLVHAFVLGIIQGITEFLPISSSGHLIILPEILGWEAQGLAVDAVLHLVTALAIIVYFRADWWRLIKSWRKGQSFRKVVIASIPAALFGLLFNNLIEQTLRSPWIVVVMLVIVAGVMWLVESTHATVTVIEAEGSKKKRKPVVELDWPEALVIGVAQVLALIPGTSRSGITISAGMWRSVNRVTAAKFSFLLGVPVTLGAGLVKLPDLIGSTDTDWMFVGVAAVTTFVVALATIHWLLKFLHTHTLKPFAMYRVGLAVVVAAFLLLER